MTQQLVYRYGLRPPTAHADVVLDQMRRAHRYRNMLIEISRGHRDAQRSVIGAVPAVVAATERAVLASETLATVEAQMGQEHVRARARKHEDSTTDTLAIARRDWEAAFEMLSTARNAARRTPAVSAELTRFKELADEIAKSARDHYGPWWGTYHLVDNAHEQSLRLVLGPGKSIALPLWSGLRPRDPKFISWAEATRAVGAYNNAGPGSSSDKFVSVQSVDSVPLGPTVPGVERAKKYLLLRMLVATTDKRQKIWAEWPIIFDRPLPKDAVISAVRVQVVREGPGERWEALFSLSTDLLMKDRGRSTEVCGVGRVGVDIGWRAMEDGSLRVGYVAGDHGHEALGLSSEMLSQLTKAASLRGIRDDLFNRTKLALMWWIATCGALVPEWMPTVHKIDAWKSPERLLRLCFEWRQKRFIGDQEIYDLLDGWTPEHTPRAWRRHDESWRRQDRHLSEWEAAQRAKALAHRKDFYRVYAAKLARQYNVLALERFDLRKVSKVPKIEDSEDAGTIAARAQRTLAAVSELRGALISAFTARGGRAVFVDPANSTHECPSCAVVTEFDARTKLCWVCVGCEKRWDQDYSAALVLRQRSERSDDEQNAAIARGEVKAPVSNEKRVSKWEKIRNKKAAKEAARELGGEGAE